MLENLNIYDILGYGVIGLGFLLAALAYKLLSEEQKKEPRPSIIKAIYTFMVFSVVLCIIGFAAQVFDSDSGTDPEKNSKFEACQDSLTKLNMNSISKEDLQLISEDYFTKKQTRPEMLATIRDLVAAVNESEKEQQHYAYKLFKLEKEISNFGNNISVKINDDRRTKVYQQIQTILQEISFYKGPIDGQQKSTYDALVNFQKNYNTIDSTRVFQEYEYGILGYRTLEAFRSTYRRLGS